MIRELSGKKPEIDNTCFIAESSAIVGNVVIQKNASVWFSAVIRGDFDSVEIGENSNVQDNASIHCDATYPVRIGKNVSIGHNAVIHGSTIGDNVLIGMNSTVLNSAEIGDNSIIGAGAVVPEGMKIPANSLVVGVPAKIIKSTTPQQVEHTIHNANLYHAIAKEYIAAGMSEV